MQDYKQVGNTAVPSENQLGILLGNQDRFIEVKSSPGSLCCCHVGSKEDSMGEGPQSRPQRIREIWTGSGGGEDMEQFDVSGEH